MANPYDSVSIQNFNVSPPSDDASQVSGNQLEWKKHLDKHATPLKNLAESINTNVVAAFGKRLGTTFELKATNYSIAAPGDQGKIFSVTGTTTMTLPLVADAGDGFPVAIINNGSGTVTVETTASELIDGSTSFTLAATEFAIVTTDGSTWTAAISSVNTFVDTTLKAVKTADETVNDSDTLQDDDHLFVTVVSGKYYHVKLYLRVTSNSTPEFSWKLDGPGAVPTGTWVVWNFAHNSPSHTVFAQGVFETANDVVIGGPTEEMVVIEGVYKAPSAGTFKLQWAQTTATVADTKVLEGSCMILTEVG